MIADLQTLAPAAEEKPASAKRCLERGEGRLPFWCGLLTALCVLAVYNAVFFNRYFPLTEGWFPAYARLMLSGNVPYRDFYLFLPPLYPMQLAVFASIFGDGFLALRIMGIFVVLSMAGVSYLLYARWFPPFVASLVTIVSMVYYQSGVAHITYDFTQFLTAYALFSTYCIVRHCERQPAALTAEDFLWPALAGIFSALAFLTKQSNGAFIVLFCGLAVLLGSVRWGTRHAAGSTALYVLGAGLPVLLVLFWLFRNGALAPFIDQVYFGAVQSKGSLDNILFRWTTTVFTREYVAGLWRVVLIILPLLAFSFGREALGVGTKREFWYGRNLNLALLGAVAAVGCFCVLISLYHPRISRIVLSVPGTWFWSHVVIVSTATTALAFAKGLLPLVSGRRDSDPSLLILATVALGMIWGNGTSAGIGEISSFVGLALFLGALLSLRSDLFAGKALIMALAASFVVFLASNKYDVPYDWWSVVQPGLHGESKPVPLKVLRGFQLSEDTVRILSEVTAVVEANAAPGEPILAFPHMPVFYLLTDRWPDLKGIVHWFDFLPDDKAEAEAQRLLSHPPKVIINLDLPEFVWTEHERAFRIGNRMGQRSIRAAIALLTGTPGAYVLEKTYAVPNNCVLKVWRRI